MKTPEKSVIEKVLKNKATQQEAREVAQWFSTPDGQQWLSKRMDVDKNVPLESLLSEEMEASIPSEKLYKQIMLTIRKRKTRQLLLNVAAIVVPLIMFAGFYIELNSRVDLFATAEYDEIHVPKGEQMQIMFQDGSRVYLNSGSHLRYPRKFGLFERKVELNGEGWFDIAKSKGRPFIVDLEDVQVKVLGTTFDVKAYAEDNLITIAQETGSIEFSGITFSTFNLAPGEKIIYNKASGQCKVIRPENIKASSSWREKVLDFRDTSLTEVMTTLGRSFDVSFEVEDKAALKYHYNLHTKETELDMILKELEKITPVRFERQEDLIRVRLEK